MYEIQPKKTNELGRNLALVLFFGGALAMYFSTLPNLPLRPVMQMISILVLAFSLMLLGRYVFKSFSYAVIENDEGGLDFTVTELKRRSRITLTRVSLSGISEVIPLSESSKKILAEKKKGRILKNLLTDRLLGLAVGLVRGVAYGCILLMIISYCAGLGENIQKQVDESKISAAITAPLTEAFSERISTDIEENERYMGLVAALEERLASEAE